MTKAEPAETGPKPEPPPTPRDAGKARRKPAQKSAPKPGNRLEQPPGEVGGTNGPEPTRYGDWSHNGICSDF